MRKEDFKQLIDKYLNGVASPNERSLVEEYYSRMAELEPVSQVREDYEKNAKEEVLSRILQSGTISEDGERRFRSGFWFRVAASVLVLTGCGLFYLSMRHPSQPNASVKSVKSGLVKDIAPGGNKAVLTLSNGEKIVLDTAQNGNISLQGNSQVSKLSDGQLSYHKTGIAQKEAAVTYNTLTTPRGGQYKISLPDGTKVWLNASSSLTYPTSFTNKERRVEITGEAYFEVVQNPNAPFVVRVKDAEVQVLGTNFNVMAYDDESATRTTLIEGAVKMCRGTSSLVLEPGQQARLMPDGNMRLVKDADTEAALAWKNNLFSFNDDEIHATMRQIARWYDVDIVYEGVVPDHFNGNISRSVNVSEVFKMLQLTGRVHFEIEGKKIIVRP